MIPRSRAEVTGPLSWLAWALAGNDDGGIYGERDHYAAYYAEHGPSAWLAIQWWARNPAANLMKIVLAKPRPDGIKICREWSEVHGWRRNLVRQPQEKWPDELGFRQFAISSSPPGIFWRGMLGTEGYWGWHSSGWFCILPTIRRVTQ